MCIGFFYDILVYSADLTKHEKHLGMVFAVMRDIQLFANKKKYVTAHSQIQYLGHLRSNKGVEVDEEMIRDIVNCPQPKDVTGWVERFFRIDRVP